MGLRGLINSIAELDHQVILLVVMIIIAIIVIDALLSRVEHSSLTTGLTIKSVDSPDLALEGIPRLAIKDYISETQELSGRPDAVIKENGFLIPVEHKPLAKKMRDRYIAQLLIYMRLIEELEGTRPPYGYLVLGKSARRVKISNTPERQRWIDQVLTEMRAVLDGEAAKATPHPAKCAGCQVAEFCEFKAERPKPTT